MLGDRMTQPAASPARNAELLRRHEAAMREKIERGLREAARRIALKIAAELRLPPENNNARS
jgi:hypothetical protein